MIVAVLISIDGHSDAAGFEYVPAMNFMSAPVDLNGFSQVRILLIEWFTTFMFTFAVISICAQSSHNCLNALFVGLSLYFNLTVAAGVSGAFVNPAVAIAMGLKTILYSDLDAVYFLAVFVGTLMGGVTAPFAYKALHPAKESGKKHNDDDEDQNALM